MVFSKFVKLFDDGTLNAEGKNVVVIGKSNIVGMPLSLMLMNHDATVTVCHIKTKDLKMHTRNADIIFCACGVPHLINKEYLTGSGKIDGRDAGECVLPSALGLNKESLLQGCRE